MRRGIVAAIIVFSLLIPVITTSCDTTQPPEGEAVIGPDGGTLEIDDEDHPLCGFKIEFPENALNTSTTIQVRPVEDTGELPPYVESYCSPFEVLPSGLVFDEPVIMTVPFDFDALDDTDFVYILLFDENNDEWDRCGVISYNYAGSTVTVGTLHFSEGVAAKSTVDFNQSVYTSPVFDKETDRFPITQQGPECKGISAFTAWYFKEVGQGLRNAYCDFNRADDLAEHAHAGLLFCFTYPWSHDKGAVARNLWLGLKDDKTPQLVNMKQSGTFPPVIHMAVVYKYEGHYFYVQDPMRPSVELKIEVVGGQLGDYVQYDYSGTVNDEIYDLFRFESSGVYSDAIVFASYSVYPPDSDCDDISDDGDLSKTLGDHPCTDGDTEDCDDNCPETYNPNQADSDGDGIGDACEVQYDLTMDFKQYANEDDEWTSSILQASNSEYYECMSVPQRTILAGIPSAPGGEHTFAFSHQATKGGIHAYDWLTAYNQGNDPPLAYDPCGEQIGDTPDFATICGNLHSSGYSILVDVPDDPFISKDGSTQDRIDAYEAEFGNRQIRIYGDQPFTAADLTLSHTVANNGDTGDSYIEYELTWTSDSTQILIEMAGHLAMSGDPATNPIAWGFGLGASYVSGGPFHFKLGELDGASLGSQDNQIYGAGIL